MNDEQIQKVRDAIPPPIYNKVRCTLIGGPLDGNTFDFSYSELRHCGWRYFFPLPPDRSELFNRNIPTSALPIRQVAEYRFEQIHHPRYPDVAIAIGFFERCDRP